MNFENALYYTLSTVTQTLGGAVALSGAFVLLRYQIIDSRLHAAAMEALDSGIIPKTEELNFRNLLSEGKYGLVREALNAQIVIAEQNGGGSQIHARSCLHQMRVGLKRFLELKLHFIWLLMVSIPVMALAAVGLALVPVILVAKGEGVVLIVALVAFVTVLIQIAFLLYRQLVAEVNLPETV